MFEKIKTVALEYEEVQDLKGLLLSSVYNLMDYEADVIELMAMNMQAAEDASALCEFIDTFCPYVIAKRPSSGFLTQSLIEMYQELASHCGIPRTCFALLKAIDVNPDSPYLDNSFYLKAKNRYFYENYICKLRSIFEAINDGVFRAKFLTAYQKNVKSIKSMLA